jgi:hypothetical protein
MLSSPGIGGIKGPAPAVIIIASVLIVRVIAVVVTSFS